MGLEIKKTTTPTVFFRSQPNLMRTLATIGGIQAITFFFFFAIDQVLKTLWHFEI